MDRSVDDALDELYQARPQDFTEVRTRLAAAAKAGGDATAARRISGSRKPTTAAWTVNLMVLADGSVRERLSDLGSRLREAHAAMDGAGIRALTAEQRGLVEELTRRALQHVPGASGALRDDVAATLQAAVADPDVTARLGRLTKAERWSGFGDFGSSVAVTGEARKTAPRKPESRPSERGSEELRRARAVLAAAERAKAQADAALAELQTDLATARLRRDDARRRLADAEEAATAAEDAYDAGKRSARDAAAALEAARTGLAAAED